MGCFLLNASGKLPAPTVVHISNVWKAKGKSNLTSAKADIFESHVRCAAIHATAVRNDRRLPELTAALTQGEKDEAGTKVFSIGSDRSRRYCACHNRPYMVGSDGNCWLDSGGKRMTPTPDLIILALAACFAVAGLFVE